MKNYCIDSWFNKVALQMLLAWLVLGCTSVFAIAATGSLDLDWKAPLAQDHPLVGKIYQSNAEISLQSLVDVMADNRYVLIGEKHDNIDHHQLELYLLKLLVERNAADNTVPSVDVALEMIDSSQQPQVDSVMKHLNQDDGAELQGAELKDSLDWPAHGWPWDDYAALIGWTLNNRLPLYAGNIARKTIQTVYKNGIDDRFTSARELKAPLQDELLDQVFGGHCGLMPRESLGSMVDIQLAKDSAMADALVGGSGKQSVLIAGTGHIRKDTSVPKHLQVLGGGSVLTVALVEVDSEKQGVAEYDLFDRFDVVIFTPIANQRDYCADLEKSMQKKVHKK